MENILITGASTGIGHACVKYLIERDYFVFGSVRKEADAQRLQDEFGDHFQALLFDVTDEPAIEKAKYTVVEKEDDFELRQYEGQIVAETYVEGSLKDSGNDGFDFAFIFLYWMDRSFASKPQGNLFASVCFIYSGHSGSGG